MKQTLALKIGQSLTMTPQLQQAIKLLALSALDLQLEVQQAIETNPLLEIDEAADLETAEEEDQAGESLEPDTLSAAEAPESEGPQADSEWQEEIPEDLPVDTSWDDIYQPSTVGNGSALPDDALDSGERNTAEETLLDHLRWQLNLAPMSDRDEFIALTIIDAINPDGMLSTAVEELTTQFDEALEIEADEVLAVLRRVQQFDPIGVGSRDLSECLLLQLKALPDDTDYREKAITLVEDHLDLLAARDFTTLGRKSKLCEEELIEVIQIVQSLNPRPGSAIAANDTEYITPDVYVRKDNGRWLVELNSDAAPRLRINQDYAGLIRRADSSADNEYLKNNLQEARWFIRSLQSRNETLLKVATKIVEHQRGFLDYGPEAMKPLVLAEIADAIEMHESTISRVTSRKYMHTPRGIFEMKYFFSSHVSTNSGGEVSSIAIRALIKKMVAEENARKPLSDNKIAAILGEQNIKVARRTVAKYREALAIPPSNERKRLV